MAMSYSESVTHLWCLDGAALAVHAVLRVDHQLIALQHTNTVLLCLRNQTTRQPDRPHLGVLVHFGGTEPALGRRVLGV